jgi:dolichol-phosphate mannosyltransferase
MLLYRMYDEEKQLAPLLSVPQGSYRVPPIASQPTDSIRLSVIVPTYREAKNIADLVARLSHILDPLVPDRYEVIVVDDDSPDGTWQIAQQLTANYPALRVMRREGERGLSTAVIRGWQAARGDILAVLDGDLQHPPETTADLYRAMEAGSDLALATRHVEGGGVSDWSLFRRFISRGAQLLGLVVLPEVVGKVSDPMSGYFMVRRAAVQEVELHPLGYKILIEVLARGRCFFIREVPYVFRERDQGESKVTLNVYWDFLRHLVQLRVASIRSSRFLRFAIVGASGVVVDMGLLFLLSDPSTLGWGLTRSKLLAAEVAIINNFLWNDAWTFHDVSGRQPNGAWKLRRFGKFQLVCFGGLILNTLLLNLQFNVFHVNRYIANAVAILIVTGWNFWLNLKFSWRNTQTKQSP